MAPVSQPDLCADCGADLAAGDFSARFVCPSCGHPQPLAPELSYFEALGAPERFAQDRKELESRFFRVSRALHPDRFSASGDAGLVARSQTQMAFLNQAYRTLTHPEDLRAYVLARAGFKDGKKSAPPLELAEEWFELQEAAMENPAEADEKLDAFLGSIAKNEAEVAVALANIEQRVDTAATDGRSPELAELHGKVQELSYLKSLKRDVERLRGRLGP